MFLRGFSACNRTEWDEITKNNMRVYHDYKSNHELLEGQSNRKLFGQRWHHVIEIGFYNKSDCFFKKLMTELINLTRQQHRQITNRRLRRVFFVYLLWRIYIFNVRSYWVHPINALQQDKREFYTLSLDLRHFSSKFFCHVLNESEEVWSTVEAGWP